MKSIQELLLDIKHAPKVEPEDKIMSSKEVAEFLNVSLATIYTKVNKREIPFMKRGKHLLFSKNDIISWLKEGSVKAEN